MTDHLKRRALHTKSSSSKSADGEYERKHDASRRGGRTMRILIALTLVTMLNLPEIAAAKDSGTTTLKEVQSAGTTNKKQKHQQYDRSFASGLGKEYTCRTAQNTSVKATDLVVGSRVTYEVKGDKGKVKTAAGRQVSCTVVRVAMTPAGSK